jgi:hypothetical protein
MKDVQDEPVVLLMLLTCSLSSLPFNAVFLSETLLDVPGSCHMGINKFFKDTASDNNPSQNMSTNAQVCVSLLVVFFEALS